MSKKKEPDRTMTVQQPEARYGRSELIDAAFSFGVKPEVVAGALKMVAKDCMTKAEAKEAIKKFLERKV